MIKGAEKLPFYFYSLNGEGIHSFCALKGGLSVGEHLKIVCCLV